jgi:hypothetical protein
MTVTEMVMKNVCEVLIFRLPTVGKLLSFLNTGQDSGGERGGTAERQPLPIQIYGGNLGFIVIFL